MGKIDKTVARETKYIALWVIGLSLIMHAVFLIIGEWDYTVLLGNTVGGGTAILNFFLLGITVQKAVTKDEASAKTAMKTSQLYRFMLMLIVVVLGAALPVFHLWSVILPLLFPRIAIAFRPLFDKKLS